MKIEKTQALALRIMPYANTSHIVLWLTEAGERLATMVKGACRPKSAFLGQYDLFAACELLYYRRDGAGMHLARECALVTPRAELRRDWRAFGGASYVSHLILGSSMEGQCDAAAYPLADIALNAFATAGARQEILFWFELQWLGHMGLAPQLRQCSRCRKPLPEAANALHWSREGIVCPGCVKRAAAPTPGAGLMPLPPDILAILRRWQEQPQAHVLTTTQCSARQFLEFERILGSLMAYHVDDNPKCRNIALQLMRATFDSKEKAR